MMRFDILDGSVYQTSFTDTIAFITPISGFSQPANSSFTLFVM
jgi:hypothetical protein